MTLHSVLSLVFKAAIVLRRNHATVRTFASHLAPPAGHRHAQEKLSIHGQLVPLYCLHLTLSVALAVSSKSRITPASISLKLSF